MGSVNEGTGENGRQLRKELKVVLVSRFNDIYSDEGRCETARSILDGLEDLMRQRGLSEVVGTLEICGVLSHSESLHFDGASSKQQVIEEAKGLLQPLRALPILNAYKSKCNSIG